MPRPPPVTRIVASLLLPSFLIVASARVDLAARLILGLAIEDRLHRREAVDEAIDRLRPRDPKLRREQVIHVELLARPAGPLHVEPERERDADHEAGGGDPAHQPLAPRLHGE